MSYQYTTSGGQSFSYGATAGSQAQYQYQQPSAYQPSGAAPSSGPTWNWWIPAEGISREVIQVDIQRYLGPEAVCKPGKNDGVNGYYISAYRNFTPAMIQDLKADSANWHRERRPNHDRYENSQVHQSRQYWGPTDGRQGNQPAPQPSRPQQQQSSSYSYPSGSGYGQPESRQQTTPSAQQTAPYQQPQYGYSQAPAASPSSTTSQYSNTGGGYSHTSGQPQYANQFTQAQAEPRVYSQPYSSGQQASQQAYQQTPSSQQQQVRPGYYLASDGRQYPYPSNPSTSQ